MVTKMKRTVAILLVVISMVTLLTGCSKDRELYDVADLADYVTVGEYKGVEIDTQSENFKAACQDTIDMDVEDNNLYNLLDSEGIVADGDIVNLDYEGKIDGVAFNGGTAKGYNLVIGSGIFIDDFEEELIGAVVGETRDVTAQFPENYGNEAVNGKEAVFTCKINYIQRAMTVEESYKKMGFDSVEEYQEDIKVRAIKNSILNKVCDASKINDYPDETSEKLNEAIYEAYVELFKNKYNADLEQVLASNGSSVDVYKNEVKTQMLPPMLETSIVMYAILDMEELEIYESTIQSQEVSQPVIAECYAVREIVLDYLYDNAKIK